MEHKSTAQLILRHVASVGAVGHDQVVITACCEVPIAQQQALQAAGSQTPRTTSPGPPLPSARTCAVAERPKPKVSGSGRAH